MRVLLADDHDLVRDTLSAYLIHENFEVSSCRNLDEALQLVKTNKLFDVILLDYTMPGMNGLEGLKKMREASSDRPIAIITGTAKKTVAEEAIAYGARGFIPKSLPAKTLINAVKFIVMGETYLPAQFSAEEEIVQSIDLTGRERQILDGICEGKSNKEIAIAHDIQEVTVKLHVKTVMKKLGAKNRTHAAMLARDLQLV